MTADADETVAARDPFAAVGDDDVVAVTLSRQADRPVPVRALSTAAATRLYNDRAYRVALSNDYVIDDGEVVARVE